MIIIILLISAIMPPNLFGIDRKIQYANKKYHSGCICVGVIRGFAFIKFSGSLNVWGIVVVIKKNYYSNEYNCLYIFSCYWWNGIWFFGCILILFSLFLCRGMNIRKEVNPLIMQLL